MGAHLLSLRELAPALLHLVDDEGRGLLAYTRIGAMLLDQLIALAAQVEAALRGDPDPPAPAADPPPEADDWGEAADLAHYPGYAELAHQHRCQAERAVGSTLWARLEQGPPRADPAGGSVQAVTPLAPAEAEALRARVAALMGDLRQGLRIEVRYRPGLPADLDRRLFGPFDRAVRRKREGARAADAREPGPWRRAPLRRPAPSLEAGPIGS